MNKSCKDVQTGCLQQHVKIQADELKAVRENESNRFYLSLTLWPSAELKAVKKRLWSDDSTVMACMKERLKSSLVVFNVQFIFSCETNRHAAVWKNTYHYIDPHVPHMNSTRIKTAKSPTWNTIRTRTTKPQIVNHANPNPTKPNQPNKSVPKKQSKAKQNTITTTTTTTTSSSIRSNNSTTTTTKTRTGWNTLEKCEMGILQLLQLTTRSFARCLISAAFQQLPKQTKHRYNWMK